MDTTTPGSPGASATSRPSSGSLLDSRAFTYSVVIPVFNSAAIVGHTADQVVNALRAAALALLMLSVCTGPSGVRPILFRNGQPD